MGSLKVLHLASFHGNIGDNANHSGFRPWLEKLSGLQIEWTDLEIREYYWKEKRFDQSFVNLVSKFDLLVVGGGNYFELWVEKSATGTSIDIPLDIFAQIKTPVFFNALGCDEGQGVTNTSLERFTRFLEVLTASDQYLVTVRNDGAMRTLRKHVPVALTDKVFVIPDGGFFLEYQETPALYLKPTKKRIGINLASDMAEIRFKNFGNDTGYANFCHEFAELLGTLAKEDPEIHFFFFPHIFRDLAIISDVISKLDDRLRRTRIATAPYVNGPEGAKHLFGLYQHCDLFLGMRFHANVCALSMGIPTIGLCNYPQIDFLYEELDFPEGCLSVRDPGYSNPLRKLIFSSLNAVDKDAELERVHREILLARRAFEPRLIQWLKTRIKPGH